MSYIIPYLIDKNRKGKRMMLFTSILKSVASRRDVKLFFGFIILPILVPFLSQTMDGARDNFGQSFLTFLDLTLVTQYRVILPVMIFSLVITSVFRDEIDSGIRGILFS